MKTYEVPVSRILKIWDEAVVVVEARDEAHAAELVQDMIDTETLEVERSDLGETEGIHQGWEIEDASGITEL